MTNIFYSFIFSLKSFINVGMHTELAKLDGNTVTFPGRQNVAGDIDCAQ